MIEILLCVLIFLLLVLGPVYYRTGYEYGVHDAVLEFTEPNHPGAKEARVIMERDWRWRESRGKDE